MTDSTSHSNVILVNNRVVAIDGGTATGKSRLGHELAQLLRRKGVPALFISTGYLYRAVSWVALQKALGLVKGRRAKSPEMALKEAVALVHDMDEAAMVAVAERHQIAMHVGQVWIDEAEASVDTQLKAPGIGLVLPHVASFLAIRQIVNESTRRQVNEFDGYVIVEGRDIGHTVLPEAPLRVLLVVSPEVAAQRSVEHTVDQVIARDKSDRAHKHGALKSADDAADYTHVLSTDDHTPESVRDHVYGLMRQAFPVLPEI